MEHWQRLVLRKWRRKRRNRRDLTVFLFQHNPVFSIHPLLGSHRATEDPFGRFHDCRPCICDPSSVTRWYLRVQYVQLLGSDVRDSKGPAEHRQRECYSGNRETWKGGECVPFLLIGVRSIFNQPSLSSCSVAPTRFPFTRW